MKTAALTENYVILNLKSDPNETIGDAYSLRLVVDRTWWENQEISDGSIFISINERHLRPHPMPREPSTLTLFDRVISVNHSANDLDIQVNATIDVPLGVERYQEHDKGFTGILKSGSIIFRNFAQTFLYGEGDWLSNDPNPRTELLLGHSRIQLKLPKEGERDELYEFVGEIPSHPNPQYLWKLIHCPHENSASAHALLSRYENNLIEHLSHSAAAQAVTIEKFAQPGMGVYLLKYEEDTQYKSENYLKPGLKVHIHQETSTPNQYGNPLVWTPQSFKVSADQSSYTLMDYDQIDELLTQGKVTRRASSFDLTVSWRSEGRQVNFDTPLFLAHPTNPNVAKGQYLWQKGQLKSQNSPFEWIRYRLNELPASTEVNENSTFLTSQTENLRGALFRFYDFDSSNAPSSTKWKLLVDVAEKEEESTKSQIELTITSSEVTVGVNQPRIVAVSPQMPFFAGDLLDPSSMPANKEWTTSLESSAFVFQNALSESSLPLAEKSIRLELKSDRTLGLRANPHQMIFFKSTPMALIDRVSPSRNNLEAEDPGPTTQRDPNHSLSAWEIELFSFLFDEGRTIIIPSTSHFLEKYSTEALMPWVERMLNETDNRNGDGLKFYHRNLVLEHSEFELAQAYHDEEALQSTYNASDAFIQAVRDRYCEAADLKSTDRPLQNWFPGAQYTYDTTLTTPQISYRPSGTFPQIAIEWSGAVPLNQTLAINQTDRNWLDYHIKPTVTDEQLSLEIQPTQPELPTDYYHTINGNAPLMFSDEKVVDNLGVIREDAHPQNDDNWSIELIDTPKWGAVRSISTTHKSLSNKAASQVIFTCDALKVLTNGKLPHLKETFPTDTSLNEDFHDTETHLGAFGFYSEITAEGDLSYFNYWPRFYGIPFLVTKVTKLTLKADQTLNTIEFKAIIGNPFDPKATLKSEKEVHFLYEETTQTLQLLDQYFVDWQLTSSKPKKSHPVEGSLSRLIGNITLRGNQIFVTNFLKEAYLHADIFGKLWPLAETSLELSLNVEISGNRQTRYAFTSFTPSSGQTIGEGEATRPNGQNKLVITSFTSSSATPHDYHGSICRFSHNGSEHHLIIQGDTQSENLETLSFHSLPSDLESCSFEVIEFPYLIIETHSLHYHLPVKLNLEFKVPQSRLDLEGIISDDHRLILYLADSSGRVKALEPQITQGSMYCFLVHSSSQRAEETMLIWIERGAIATLLTENLGPNDTYLPIYFQGGGTDPCTQSFLAGLNVHYLAPQQGWYTYTAASLILSKGNVTLRFDDQDFSPINRLRVEQPVIKTAFIQVNGPSGQVQGPVRIVFTKNKMQKIVIHLKDDWFSLNRVELTEETITKPDIAFLNEGQVIRRAIPNSSSEAQDYVSLKHTQEGLRFFKIDDANVPINLCLEPEVVSNATKMKKDSPQLIHRQMFGSMLRLELAEKLYHRPLEVEEDHYFHLSDLLGNWLLSPIGENRDQQLTLMSDNTFLETTTLQSEGLETETVLILNRPIATAQSPYTAFSNRTMVSDQDHASTRFTEIQDQVYAAGVNGVIVRRLLQADGTVNYSLIPSPFYSKEVVRTNSNTSSLTIQNESASTPVVRIDFRSLAPQLIRKIKQLRSQSSYKMSGAAHSPCNCIDGHCCCSFKREAVFEYQGNMSEDFANRQPTFYLYETPAYQNMDPLWHLPSNEQQTDRTLPLSNHFLPHKIELRYGSDKPGAMFHHESRNVVHDNEQWQIGKLNDYAMREPQQIKTDGCTTTAIENVTFESEQRPFSAHKLTAQWRDIFGRISLEDINQNTHFQLTNLSLFQFAPAFPTDEENVPQFPFKLIVHHNYSVYPLLHEEAAIPAYYHEEEDRYSWSAYYLASKNEHLLPETLPEAVEIDDPDPSNPTGKQMVAFTFAPYFVVAKVSFLEFDREGITLSSEEEASYLRSLGDSVELFIPGLQVEMNRETPWKIGTVDETKLTIKDASALYGTAVKKELYVVVNMENALERKKAHNGTYLWSFKLSDHLLQPPYNKFQIIWLGRGELKIKVDDTIMRVNQLASCPYYSVEKIVKGLMPALTSPKVAGVFHLDQTKKTLFFGDSSSPNNANHKLELKNDIVNATIYADDREEIELALAPTLTDLSRANLFVVKYLIHGEVVYGEA